MSPLPHHDKTLLRVYLVFRATLATVLAGMFISDEGSNILGTQSPPLFFWASLGYVAVCLTTLFLSPAAELVRSFSRLVLSLVTDAVAMLLMLHASGGIESGLGYLLLVFVAIGSIFIRGQLGIAYAAMISLLVVAESVYMAEVSSANSQAIFSAGSLGALLFATAFAFQSLTEKIRASNLEALQQAQVAEHLQRLAQAIVARMRTGIVVVDGQGRIELINESALQLMDLPRALDQRSLCLKDIPPLAEAFDYWRAHPAAPAVQILPVRAGQEARVSLADLDLGTSKRKVIYLEDHRVMTQQAQQMKLASLGRLTASIAHEVRNPLGAISHAAQLLAESQQIAPEDVRLTEIIEQHAKRVNQIIESVLTLSRRKEPRPELLDLSVWLPRFAQQFSHGQPADIQLKIPEDTHWVKMDPTHLSQVLTNLIDNGLRYSRAATGEARVEIAVGKTENDDVTHLEVIDFGEGIAESQLAHIFEPFFTTSERGSGLGLYISRELCEINQASLHYLRDHLGRSCFRIDFSHHQRIF